MTRTTPRAHYVKHNKVTRIPRGHIYLDSEALQHPYGAGETQTFRCAVTAYDARSHHNGTWRAREWGEHGNIDALWTWITDRTQARARTVLVAHNLAYDLRICDAFGWLPAHGWELKAFRLSDRQAWCTWRNAGRTLVCVDSLAWVALPLERIGELVGIPKLDLPAWDDSDDAWYARCRRDVEIVGEAWRRVLDWLTTEDLGNWKPTGAGQAWAAYRHRFMAHNLFVHEDDDARAAERDSVFAGRCEAWQHGKVRGGPFTEWDFSNAYAAIGAQCRVPVKLAGELMAPSLDTLDVAARKCAVLARVHVTCDVPILPARIDGRIVWPVGSFDTTAWDHELAVARAAGATVRVDRAWWYKTAPALEAFCSWVLEGVDERNADADPVVRAVLKHWGRALIGRTAAQWSRWEQVGVAPYGDVALGRCINASAGTTYDLLHLGTQLIRATERHENPDAMVAVMAWVMAEARVRLWKALQTAGETSVVYVDTDSLWVTAAGDTALRAAQIPGLRVKRQARALEVFGPRQLLVTGELVAAGIPKRSVRIDARTFEGEVWSGLATGLRAGERDFVRVTRRLFRLHGIDRRRLHLPDGTTEPVTIGDVADIPATRSA